MTALGDLLGRCDPDPVRRGRQFERICQWFLTNDPVYAHELRRVWLWHEWPGRWGADAGIDLVAEDHHGHLWAIQAKAYDAAYRITKRDVDTFLAESGRPMFSFRLLIATTDLIGQTAKRTIEGQEKQASVLLLGDLGAAEVDWPTSPSDLRYRRSPPKRPRPHQRQAINAVVKGFVGADRGQLIMASGTGKTLTALFIHEKLAAQRTLVLVPSLSLLAQTLHVWTANAKVGFDFLPVCSDETVAESDAVVSNTSDLGFPVTTDAEQIARFLRRRSGPQVVFSTYQSSPEIAKAFRLGRVPLFDLAIADEAHRCAGPVSSDFATILDHQHISARRRLFMTATPRYFTGRIVREAREADFEVASMDDEAAFGPVFHRLGFAEAIERDLLTDYQVVVVGVDDATYRNWAQRGRFVTIDGTKMTDARTLAGQIGLARAMHRYDLHRMITFHSRVKRAQEFAHSLPEVIAWMPTRHRPKGNLWCDYASGEMPAGKRQALLQHLGTLNEGERGLLANARCLAEGIDVPTLDGVAFIDPRHSEIDIVQAVGRAIRLAPDKTVGTIVIPVFIGTAEDPEIALDDSAFKPVWEVIKALRSHDDELGEQLDELRRQLGRWGGQPRLPGKIHLDLPVRVGIEFARAFDVRLVEKTSARWEFSYGLLEKYTAEYGTARVPVDYVMDEYPLGQWASVQRGLYTKGQLTDDRRDKLESLPGWSWDVLSDKWDLWIGLMHQFVTEHGHAKVPVPYMVGEYNLRSWVATQRGLYRRGELSEERIRELEALPGWSWDLLADRWNEYYDAVKAFATRLGHARVPSGYVENRLPLGQWVAVQRQLYRQQRPRGEMSPERAALLEALPGWSWDPFTDRWEKAYGVLVKFTDREGHARVPNEHREDGVYLGKWVKHQRTKRDKLTNDQRKRLEALPGWSWDARTDMWHRKFALLQQFQKREGHALAPQGYVEDGVNLGSWVLTQRNTEKTMSAERRALLESVPGWTWDPHNEAWDRHYAALTRFAVREGHARVPANHIEGGLKLGGWVAEQRSNRTNMTTERRKRLDSVQGWSWNAVGTSWTAHLELLKAFAAREEHTRVPVDYVENGMKLGQWTRFRRKEGTKLSAERQSLLEAIPGWYWGRTVDYIWDQKFEALETFVKREGHARVPTDHVEDGVKLGSWVAEQRSNRNILAPERVSRLGALPGWTWNPLLGSG